MARKVKKYAHGGKEDKVCMHAGDALTAIKKPPQDTALRMNCETKTLKHERWMARAFQRRNEETKMGNENSRALGDVTQARPKVDFLDSRLITPSEKRSALRYIVHTSSRCIRNCPPRKTL